MSILYPDSSNSNLEKVCTKCGKSFPATSVYFRRNGESKTGFRAQCKKCQSKRKPRREAKQGYKICTVCEREFLATPDFFYRLGNQLRAECKTCKDEKQKAKRSTPEEHAHHTAYMKEWHKRSETQVHERTYRRRSDIRHKRNIQHRVWRKRPDAKAKERAYKLLPHVVKQSREYHRREEIRAQRRAYHKVHRQLPEVRAQRLAETHSHRARKRSVQGTHTSVQIQEQLKRQRYRCYYAACGFAKFEKKSGRYVYQVEHTYPISRVAGTDIPANDMSYLVLACPTCNMRKNDKFPWEWPEGGRLL